MTGVLIKKGRDTGEACTQREGHMRTQREGSPLQAKERHLRRNQIS